MVNYRKGLFKQDWSRNLVVIATLLLSACTTHSDNAIKPSLEKCEVGSKLSVNPQILYQQMVECITDKNYSTASLLYARAGTITWYYSLLEPTEDNRLRHQNLAKEALNQLSQSQKEQFSASLEANFSDTKSHENICSKVIIPFNERNNELSTKLWHTAKNGYLHCT